MRHRFHLGLKESPKESPTSFSFLWVNIASSADAHMNTIGICIYIYTYIYTHSHTENTPTIAYIPSH